MDFNKLIQQARASSFGMWKLNFLLRRYIPFNKPHGFKIIRLDPDWVEVEMPYKKSNLNHIKGLHACGLATAAEYSSGLLLLSKLGMGYRIIMESLEVKYFYQGKGKATASYKLDEQAYQSQVMEPLEKDGVCYIKCEINIHDQQENLLCTAYTNWQIKSWKDVKTKLS